MAVESKVSDLPSTPLDAYLEIGRTVEYLSRAMHSGVSTSSTFYSFACANHSDHIYTNRHILDAIKNLRQRLSDHDLSNSLAAAEPLNEIKDLIATHLRNQTQEFDQIPEDDLVNRLVGFMRSVNSTLKGEAKVRQMVQLDLTAVTDPISGLPDTLRSTALEMKDWQTAMWHDVLRCLQTRAYRPAIIVGWALCYYIIRYWVFRNAKRLRDFNSELTSRNITNITDYENFFLHGESFVLDQCRLASGSLAGFTEKTQRSLQVLLDERNEFAHANFRLATAPVAQAHIERLIAILRAPPFLTS